jgi:hypothetical protein
MGWYDSKDGRESTEPESTEPPLQTTFKEIRVAAASGLRGREAEIVETIFRHLTDWTFLDMETLSIDMRLPLVQDAHRCGSRPFCRPGQDH